MLVCWYPIHLNGRHPMGNDSGKLSARDTLSLPPVTVSRQD